MAHPQPPLQGKSPSPDEEAKLQQTAPKPETRTTESTDPDPAQYPKTLYHSDSSPHQLIHRTVANVDEETALGEGWGPISALGFETAPAEDYPAVATEFSDRAVVGVRSSETAGTPVLAVDTVPDKPVTATAARGILSEPSPAGPPLPRNPGPVPRSGAALRKEPEE
jgi:hypothetical protein